MDSIFLKPMTRDMFFEYFKEYENDISLYLDKSVYQDYVYTEEKVEKYVQRQIDLKRINLAVMYNDEMIGEIKLSNVDDTSATLGIAMRNSKYKDKGYGTIAEKLLIDYAFNVLNLSTIYADVIITNTRSQHVLVKCGFHLIKETNEYKYYKIDK